MQYAFLYFCILIGSGLGFVLKCYLQDKTNPYPLDREARKINNEKH